MTETDTPQVDLVMPVYQEGPNITRALAEIRRNLLFPKHVIIVYDFDEDNTLPVIRSLQEHGEYPWVELIKNHHGRGVLGAIRSGIEATTSEVVLITMADLSDDLSSVPRMVAMIRDEGADVVCGSRYMPGGRQIGGPWFKGMLSRCAGLSLRWLAGWPIHDATNAFRAYRRSFLMRTPIESKAGFAYSMELTAKAIASGLRVEEVPSTWRDRSEGTSRFRVFAWLPQYLKWYVWALDRSLRAGLLGALCTLILVGMAALRFSNSPVRAVGTGAVAAIFYAASRMILGLGLFPAMGLTLISALLWIFLA